MRNPDTGLEHQTGQAADRYLYPNPCLIDQDECIVDDIDLPILQKHDPGTILQRDRSQRNVNPVVHGLRAPDEHQPVAERLGPTEAPVYGIEERIRIPYFQLAFQIEYANRGGSSSAFPAESNRFVRQYAQ